MTLNPKIGTSWRRRASALVAVAATAALIAGCSTGQATPTPSSTANPDDGTVLTMWARNTSNNLAQNIVDAYNATHKNLIQLTIIPNETFQTKVAAAAAAGALPDILASDVVYSPNYVQQGLFLDITKEVKGLPFYDDLSHAHTNAASLDGKIYGTPFIVDSSLILYNKTLFEEAGLDPEKGPASYADILKDAKAIQALNKPDTYGFYFGGNCPGCNAYTMFGNLAAGGDEPFTDNGKTANFDTATMEATLKLYKQLWDQGLVAPSAQTEPGATWNTLFNEGKIGILPRGTGNFANLKDVPFEWGVTALPSPDGKSTSAFIGGDVAGISSTSTHPDQAWNFLEWSLGEQNQVNVIAKSGSLPSRVDLADNDYSKASPQVVLAIKGEATGYTPSTIGYANAINNANGPWLKMVRDYIFNGNANAIKDGEKAIQASLDEVQ
jgi:multiple sugar transport system substrate-binding protein